jgi:carbon monoxide dehydrogenase subunit G
MAKDSNADKKVNDKAGDGDGDGDGGSQDRGKSKKGGHPGAGKGRRMPVQQSVDIGVPLENVYNHFTQFEEWPKFMHRVTSVNQEDESHVSFKAKIWGVSKEFKAEIEEQRPEERIQWHVTQGLSHKGVVTFHPLAPGLTRIELSVDVEPGSLIEKFARGARHVKRAMRADLHRFKAYVMMNEAEDGGWRGWIEDGEVTSSEGDDDHSGWQDADQDDQQDEPQGREDTDEGEPEATEDEDQDELEAPEDEAEASEDEDQGEDADLARPRTRASAARRTSSSGGRRSTNGKGSGSSGRSSSSTRSRSSNGKSGSSRSSSGSRSSSSRRSSSGNAGDPSSKKSRSSSSSRKKNPSQS